MTNCWRAAKTCSIKNIIGKKLHCDQGVDPKWLKYKATNKMAGLL